MAELNLKERYDFQRWIINDLVGENGFIERSHAVYDQRLAMDREMLWDFLMATQEDTMEFLLKKLDQATIINLINQEITKGDFLFP